MRSILLLLQVLSCQGKHKQYLVDTAENPAKHYLVSLGEEMIINEHGDSNRQKDIITNDDGDNNTHKEITANDGVDETQKEVVSNTADRPEQGPSDVGGKGGVDHAIEDLLNDEYWTSIHDIDVEDDVRGTDYHNHKSSKGRCAKWDFCKKWKFCNWCVRCLNWMKSKLSTAKGTSSGIGAAKKPKKLSEIAPWLARSSKPASNGCHARCEVFKTVQRDCRKENVYKPHPKKGGSNASYARSNILGH